MGSPYADQNAMALSAAIAARLGIAPPPNAWRAFSAQIANETANGDPTTRGVKNNNPLNLTDAGGTITWPGQIGRDGPFAIFSSSKAGIDAAAQNYLAGSYSGVISAYRFGDPVAIATAIQDSPWDEGHYSGTLTTALGGVSSDVPPPAAAIASPSPLPIIAAAAPTATVHFPRLPTAGTVATGAALKLAPVILIALFVVLLVVIASSV